MRKNITILLTDAEKGAGDGYDVSRLKGMTDPEVENVQAADEMQPGEHEQDNYCFHFISG